MSDIAESRGEKCPDQLFLQPKPSMVTGIDVIGIESLNAFSHLVYCLVFVHLLNAYRFAESKPM